MHKVKALAAAACVLQWYENATDGLLPVARIAKSSIRNRDGSLREVECRLPIHYSLTFGAISQVIGMAVPGGTLVVLRNIIQADLGKIEGHIFP